MTRRNFLTEPALAGVKQFRTEVVPLK